MHQQEELELFCGDCNLSICLLCVDQHSSHTISTLSKETVIDIDIQNIEEEEEEELIGEEHEHKQQQEEDAHDTIQWERFPAGFESWSNVRKNLYSGAVNVVLQFRLYLLVHQSSQGSTKLKQEHKGNGKRTNLMTKDKDKILTLSVEELRHVFCKAKWDEHLLLWLHRQLRLALAPSLFSLYTLLLSTLLPSLSKTYKRFYVKK